MKEGISVIIPVFNRESLVERTLDSVYAQTFRPIELIIVDNASTDDSRLTAVKWKEKHESADFRITVADEPHRSAAQARQTGAELATSDVIMFFDSDDVMLPELCGKAMEVFRKNPEADMVYWKLIYGLSDQATRKSPRRFAHHNLLRRHLINALFNTLSYAVKKDYFLNCGGWDTSLSAWDDWELGLRLLLGNPHTIAIPETLAVIYPQEDSITGTDYQSKRGKWEEAIAAMERVSRNQPEPLRHWLTGMLLYRRVNLAALYKSEGADEVATALLEKSLAASSEPKWRKLLLRLIYAYTSRGGRCAYLLWH